MIQGMFRVLFIFFFSNNVFAGLGIKKTDDEFRLTSLEEARETFDNQLPTQDQIREACKSKQAYKDFDWARTGSFEFQEMLSDVREGAKQNPEQKPGYIELRERFEEVDSKFEACSNHLEFDDYYSKLLTKVFCHVRVTKEN